MDVIIISDLKYVAYLNFRSKQIYFLFLAKPHERVNNREGERERERETATKQKSYLCFILSERRSENK